MGRFAVAMVCLVFHRMYGVDDLFQVCAVKKRNWTIHIAGWQPFQMVLLDGALDHAGALADARVIWPNATVS